MEAHGRPVELRLTPGQEHDSRQAVNLLAAHHPRYVIADKAYDSDGFIGKIERRGSTAVIPSVSGRTVQRPLLREQYRRRNLIERFLNKLKPHRRIATRYEKTACNFLGFVQFASLLAWIN